MQSTTLLLQPPNRTIARSIVEKRFAIMAVFYNNRIALLLHSGTNGIWNLLAGIANMGVNLGGPLSIICCAADGLRRQDCPQAPCLSGMAQGEVDGVFGRVAHPGSVLLGDKHPAGSMQHPPGGCLVSQDILQLPPGLCSEIHTIQATHCTGRAALSFGRQCLHKLPLVVLVVSSATLPR